MLAPTIEPVPPELYLAREREAGAKSEFVDGRVVAMTSASRAHDHVAGDVFALLLQALRGSSCDVFTSDLRVRTGEGDAYFYPDVTVVCGEPEWADDEVDTLVNPTLIVEVLSPSTELYDRTEKARRYRRIESLQTMLLVAQDRPSVEVLERRGEFWALRDVVGLEERLELPAIHTDLDLSEIYRRASRSW